METTNLPYNEFKIMVIKMFTGLDRKVDELTENFNKDTENINLGWRIQKNKNTLERINRLDNAEEWISDMEGRVIAPMLNSKKKRIVWKWG